MKERPVTKEEFFELIFKNNLNVHPTIEGNYPYTSIFQTPNRQVFGRIVGGGHEKPDSYFLNEDFPGNRKP